MTCEGRLPSADAYARYSADAEHAIVTQRQFQKELREIRSLNSVSISVQNPLSQAVECNLADPEVFWRVESLVVWYNAIEGRKPSSRDYFDWLAPYLKPGSFKDPSYHSFWLHEASGEEMPLNKLVGLVNFYQLEHKVTHGNAADQLHACHWLRQDLFLTADSAFHNVLAQIANVHFPRTPKPVFIDRQGSSCVTQVESILRRQR